MTTTPPPPAPPSPSPRRRAGRLPPPPPGVRVLTRPEAAAFMGVSLGTFGLWERAGRVTIPRYRAPDVAGCTVLYAEADLARLREEFRKLEEPHPDPERPGVYRVPVHRHHEILFALIDAEDLPKVVGRRWNIGKNGGRRGGTDSRAGKGRTSKAPAFDVILATATERQVPLKRIIMGVEARECKDQLVGYVNGDPLDCRRANLVVTSWAARAGSTAKRAARAGRAVSSRYKGVDWDATRRLWRAQIGARDMHKMIGRFRDEAQAAAAYDAAAREAFGAAALLNFPDGLVPAPTFLGPDGTPVREKNKYRVPRGLPAPPPGVAMLTRDEAAAMLEVNGDTFGGWELAGHVAIPRYHVKATTGTPILYAAADVARLREQLDKVGQPYPDPHPARAGTWRVPLRTLAGYIEALIDEADLEIVRGKKWNFATRSGRSYDKGSVFLVGPRDTDRLQLKRLVLGLQGQGSEKRITHANGNPLDCRRANLVIDGPDKCTRRSFKLLHRCGRPTTSRYKGVAWLEREGLWQAQIRIDDKPKRLGLFDDELDAAHTYDQAAREVWGAEARVNFPRPGELPSAAAPVAPADLWPDAQGPAAKLPGKPTDFSATLNQDGSVTLSWRSTNAAASAGVTFAVLRRLPGQREFMRIGTAAGTTSMARRPTFTDATVPAEHLAAQGEGDGGVRYIVQGARALCGAMGTGEASDVLLVRLGAEASTLTLATLAEAA